MNSGERGSRITFSGWREDYRRKLVSSEGAVRKIKPGDRVFIGTGCGEPRALVRAMVKRKDLEDVEVYHFLSLGDVDWHSDECRERFRYNTWFLGPRARQAVWEGKADYIPIMFSDIPRLFRQARLQLDVALIQVSPPDSKGFCTYGISVDIVKAAAETARTVIAQVNPQMPRTLGDSFVHVSKLDLIVEQEEPLLEWTYPQPNEVQLKVAENVAGLIKNGDTLEAGIGTIPDTLLKLLRDREDLGIHTEVFSDGLMELIESGAVSCARKSVHRGKVIASFCMGTRRLYDYVHENPLFEFHPIEYCNNPGLISRNERLAAVNVALEVDLTGQVNADSLGHRFFSGIGGQADFIRGAALAERGKPIIALPSTTRRGASRIVPRLSPGAGVVTTRGDVHYVVTEYGVAYLHGKNIRERALAIISIAHPDFRQELLNFAKEKKYVYLDQLLPLGHGVVYPENLETRFIAKDGTPVLVRPVKPTDESALREMFYRLSERSVYLRWFAPQKTLPHEKAQSLVNLDYRERMALAAFIGEEPDLKMVGLAQYELNPATNFAEAAILVLDSMQGKGIGTFLFNYLVRVARERNVEGFTAEILPGNQPVLNIINKSGFCTESKIEDGVHLVRIDFKQERDKETGSRNRSPVPES